MQLEAFKFRLSFQLARSVADNVEILREDLPSATQIYAQGHIGVILVGRRPIAISVARLKVGEGVKPLLEQRKLSTYAVKQPKVDIACAAGQHICFRCSNLAAQEIGGLDGNNLGASRP